MDSGSKPPDLTETFPKSPRERLGGLLHLPRMLDKARAKDAGLLGEYLYPCPLDKILLEFLGLDAEAILQVASEKGNLEVLSWIQERGKTHRPEEVEAWNTAFLNRGPEDEEGLRRFTKARKRIAPEREDISAWVDLIDLDEGRKVPLKSSLKGQP